MKRTVFIFIAIAAVGCKGSEASERDNTNTPTGVAVANTGTAVDNTGKNDRDRDMENTRTPEDQGGEGDRTITQLVRQSVVKEYGATTAAGNVKIVTVDGVVTLRGPVNTENERSAIGTIAQRVAGVSRVDNQLEVEKK
ncbi:MAG: BON domain-containing protein [Deltaproteobacteria bacterium HGW-Deltaproteobacteria-20]|jgi:osmotically-inducible protein OsmY|nr:MAG: BON domain-containing protein [Deltaproteobacteria bacterium HGW-Deltaproteobacteria-20]